MGLGDLGSQLSVFVVSGLLHDYVVSAQAREIFETRLLMCIFVGLWSDWYFFVVGDVFLYFAHADHCVFGVGEEEYGKVVGEPDGWTDVADSSYFRVHLRL